MTIVHSTFEARLTVPVTVTVPLPHGAAAAGGAALVPAIAPRGHCRGGGGGLQCLHIPGAQDDVEMAGILVIVLQKVPSEANPKVRNHGEGPY